MADDPISKAHADIGAQKNADHASGMFGGEPSAVQKWLTSTFAPSIGKASDAMEDANKRGGK
jgi:hypothetical protein